MSAILPNIKVELSAPLAKHFLPYQALWIQADDYLHAQGKQAFALAEKSVRIGWTFCDAFKNVRKRLQYRKRDYLFVTKDYPSALEYVQLAYDAIEFLDYTRAIVSHGEDFLKINQHDPEGRPISATEEIKIGYIKFDNGSRIIAFSSNPYAMAVYGGDVGLDEFAKHPNPQLLWQTAQARVTWGFDLAVWSSHDGEDTLFNQFAHQARSIITSSPILSHTLSPPPTERSKSGPLSVQPIEIQKSKIENGTTNSPWNLYFRVTLPDAIDLGLLDIINRTQNKFFTPAQFLDASRARAGSDEIFQQSYMCNPLGAASASIVEWSAIERCRHDYDIERLHLEADDVSRRFGQFDPDDAEARERRIRYFLKDTFPSTLALPESSSSSASSSNAKPLRRRFRLGFDVAASGQGSLAVIYIDEAHGDQLTLRALLTARTEDWSFLKAALFFFFENLRYLYGAGDESGLGRQICWEASQKFGGRFYRVNFSGKKHELGFRLMNQISVAEKIIPRKHQDIACDYFALRKTHTGARWIFTEGRNALNPNSHCDIAWAGALASHAHAEYSGWNY